VIVRAALCPSPPLLVPELTGETVVLPELYDACAIAVADLVASAPDVVAVVGPADVTATWDARGCLDLSAYAPAADNSKPAGRAALPLAPGIGALLLDAADYSGPRIFQSVAESSSPDACRELGRDLAAAAPRVALLVMGDGSARRSASAPGYLDERAEPFDASVEQAVRHGDLPALAALDPALARDLLAAGRPAWQALAGALTAGSGSVAPGSFAPAAYTHPRTEILYSAAPFGVAYLVATLDPAP